VVRGASRIWFPGLQDSLRSLAKPPIFLYDSGMIDRLTTLERAFQLANSGECATVDEIRMRLKSEGYSDGQAHTKGPSIRGQLSKLCQIATAKRPA
jgi:hypothetical protein